MRFCSFVSCPRLALNIFLPWWCSALFAGAVFAAFKIDLENALRRLSLFEPVLLQQPPHGQVEVLQELAREMEEAFGEI